MNVTNTMRLMIEGWEGCILHSYPDPKTHGEPYTIGYGHTGPDVHLGQVITKAQADQLLANDLHKFEVSVTGLVGTAPTSQQQFDALVSFAFNVGSHTLFISQLLGYHKAGNYAAAAAEFIAPRHPWFSALPGLAKRRKGERAVYLTGAYNTTTLMEHRA